jgi:hypothetical protein
MDDTNSLVESIDRNTLTPLVRQALGNDTVEVADWKAEQLHASATRARIFRVSGRARDQCQMVPWSLILKTMPVVADRDDPPGTHYWKREVLAYQSGLLDALPGGIVAPRCQGVIEQPRGAFWLWLEDVTDAIGPRWPMEHYGVVARHLGQFNGAYLMGHPIPAYSWLSRGWLRGWMARVAPGVELLRNSLGHPLVRRLYPPSATRDILDLWENREAFLAALERLPQCFSHLDGFRRNLLARKTAHGDWQTVLIDWAFAGTAAVGEELAPVLLATAGYGEIEMSQLPELDDAVFNGYVRGLREAGWKGDRRLARLGFAAAATLRYDLPLELDISMLVDEGTRARWEQVLGRPMEQAVDDWREGAQFRMGLLREARELLGST